MLLVLLFVKPHSHIVKYLLRCVFYENVGNSVLFFFFFRVWLYIGCFDLKIAKAKNLVEKVNSGGVSCLNVHNTNRSHLQRHLQTHLKVLIAGKSL